MPLISRVVMEHTGALAMILRLKLLRRWLVAVIRWIVRPWWVWVTLGLVAGAFLIRYSFSFPIENCIRLTGLAFQVLGLTTVAIGLRETRKLFNRPGWTTLAAEWWHQFPSLTPKTYVLNVEAGDICIAGDEVSLVRKTPEQDLSIEQRVAKLEDHLAEHEHLIRQMQANIVKESSLQKEALQSESRSRESFDQILERKLEEFAAGGLHLESIGLFWILMGVGLATASVEIAGLIASKSPYAP